MTRRKSAGSILPMLPPATAQQGADSRPFPRPPADLGPAGRKAWRAVMRHAPVLLPDLDALTLHRLCSLVDERELVRAELERGFLLAEPIVTPTGRVVGERLVANPAAAMLGQIDRRMDELSAALALTPRARGQLGLVLTAAERGAVELQNLLVSKYRKELR